MTVITQRCLFLESEKTERKEMRRGEQKVSIIDLDSIVGIRAASYHERRWLQPLLRLPILEISPDSRRYPLVFFFFLSLT